MNWTRSLFPKAQTFLSTLQVATTTRVWGPDLYEWKLEQWMKPLPEEVGNAKIPGVYSNLWVIHSSYWNDSHAIIIQNDIPWWFTIMHVSCHGFFFWSFDSSAGFAVGSKFLNLKWVRPVPCPRWTFVLIQFSQRSFYASLSLPSSSIFRRILVLVTGNPRVFLGPPAPTPTWNLYPCSWVWVLWEFTIGYPLLAPPPSTDP